MTGLIGEDVSWGSILIITQRARLWGHLLDGILFVF